MSIAFRIHHTCLKVFQPTATRILIPMFMLLLQLLAALLRGLMPLDNLFSIMMVIQGQVWRASACMMISPHPAHEWLVSG